MTRVPPPPDPQDPLIVPIFERFVAEGRPPIDLYRALAVTPRILVSYSQLAQTLRHEAQTPRELRELAILRVAQLTGSRYEWSHHRKMAEGLGIASEKVLALAGWERDAGVFSEIERAILRSVDELHGLDLSDAAFEALVTALGQPGAVEIIVLVSFYEAVARMINGLGIEPEPEYLPYLEPWPPE